MTDDNMELPTKSFEAILAEKEAALAKERQALENLGVILKRMGYGIVPLAQMPAAQKRRGRPPRTDNQPTSLEGAPRRRGRPPKNASAPQLVVDQPKKRRGRPPKARPESG